MVDGLMGGGEAFTGVGAGVWAGGGAASFVVSAAGLKLGLIEGIAPCSAASPYTGSDAGKSRTAPHQAIEYYGLYRPCVCPQSKKTGKV